MILFAFLISLAASAFLIPKILVISARKRLLDVPDVRKIHSVRSSRLGGIAFFPSIIFAMCFALALFSMNSMPFNLLSIDFLMSCAACMMIYLVGLADDIVGVRYRVKFVFQILAALLVVLPGTWINDLYGIFGIHSFPQWIGKPLSVFVLIFIMNAMNLIDGLDGLASGLSIIIFTVFGFLFVHFGMNLCAMLSFASLGVLLPFFYYNVFGVGSRKFKIFMGDTGALVMGLIIGFLAIRLVENDGRTPPVSVYTLAATISVLIVPCFDVVRVTIHRFRAGQPLFLPDKNHIHHKFIALGLSHKRSMVAILGLSALFIALNLALCQFVPMTVIVIADIAAWTTFHIFISRRIKARAGVPLNAPKKRKPEINQSTTDIK